MTLRTLRLQVLADFFKGGSDSLEKLVFFCQVSPRLHRSCFVQQGSA
jgi:hypothetical protein